MFFILKLSVEQDPAYICAKIVHQASLDKSTKFLMKKQLLMCRSKLDDVSSPAGLGFLLELQNHFSLILAYNKILVQKC